MKKRLLIFLFCICLVLSSFFVFSKKEKTEDFYVDIRGWSEFFKYYPESKILKSENGNFKVLNKTKNSFVIKNENDVELYYKVHFADDEYELLSKSYMHNEKNKSIAVLTFSMGESDEKWKVFYETMEKHFLPKHSKKYFVLTDNNNLKVSKNVLKIAQYDKREESLNLKKFHAFDRIKSVLKSFDYIYFADESFLPTVDINEEILPTKKQGIVSMIHPCFYDWAEDQIPFEKNIKSVSYIPVEERKYYMTKSFFGGTKDAFFELADVIKNNVELDLKKDFVPKLMDESFLNAYLNSKSKSSTMPMIVMPDAVAFKASCMPLKERVVDANLVYIRKNGEKKLYHYDSDAKILKGQDQTLDVLRRTKNTISIASEDGVKVYHRSYYALDEYEPLTQSKVLDRTPKKIAVITFVSGDDSKQWNAFYQSSKKNFLQNHHKKYFVFTDTKDLKIDYKIAQKIVVHENDFELKKHHIIQKIKTELDMFDYIYFMDVNLDVITNLNEEILPTKGQELVYAIHPWHYRWAMNLLPYARNEKSKAYIKEVDGKFYVQNVFYGGTKDGFIKLSQTIQNWIDSDIKENATPKWKEESYLNKYLVNMQNDQKDPLILTPDYIFPDTGCAPSGEFEAVKKMILKKK